MKRISVCSTKPVPEVLFDSCAVAGTAGADLIGGPRGEGPPGHQGIVSAVKMA